MKTVILTNEECAILENYLFKKIINLENSNLTDSKCYKIFWSIRQKLKKGDITNDK